MVRVPQNKGLLYLVLRDVAAEFGEGQHHVVVRDLLRIVNVEQVKHASYFLFIPQYIFFNGCTQKLRIVDLLVFLVIN